MARELTGGKAKNVLFFFSLPMLGSAAFQQFYNIVDSVIAGKFLGTRGLAAVGASYPITAIYTAVALGMNIGCTVVISQFFGGKKIEEMKTAISTAAVTFLSMAAVLLILGLLFCKGLLQVLDTPTSVFTSASDYLYIYTLGLPFVFLYNMCTGAFTATGDSGTPFLFLIISSISNVVGDLLFVCVLHQGVAGLAWATILCQMGASIAAAIVLWKRLKKMTCEEHPFFSRTMFQKIMKLAIPGILQQSFISVGNLLIQRAVNQYNEIVIAGYAAAIKLNSFAVSLGVTMSSAVSAFSAQNIGAKNYKRVKEGHKWGLIYGYLLVCGFFLAYFFAGNFFMGLFVKGSNSQVMEVGIRFLQIVSPFYFVMVTKVVCDGVLHGSASVKLFMTTTFVDLILRVALAYVLPLKFSYTGIWMAWPIGWCISATISVGFYLSGRWKKSVI